MCAEIKAKLRKRSYVPKTMPAGPESKPMTYGDSELDSVKSEVAKIDQDMGSSQKPERAKRQSDDNSGYLPDDSQQPQVRSECPNKRDKWTAEEH